MKASKGLVWRIVSVVSAVLCAVGMFLPLFMRENDIHPYVVSDLIDRSLWFELWINNDDIIVLLSWLVIIFTCVSVVAMLIFAVLGRRQGGIFVLFVGAPILAAMLWVFLSLSLFVNAFAPTYGAIIVFTGIVVHLVAVFVAPKRQSNAAQVR